MSAAKNYRKKPIVVEAFKFPGPMTQVCPWLLDAMDNGTVNVTDDYISIKTLEGTMNAFPGDWVILGIHGEIYPCKPDIFEATYELEFHP